MANTTWTYGVTALLAALVAAFERFGNAPIPAVQGTSVPAAGSDAMSTLAATHVVARKADDRFRPRGRRR